MCEKKETAQSCQPIPESFTLPCFAGPKQDFFGAPQIQFSSRRRWALQLSVALASLLSTIQSWKRQPDCVNIHLICDFFVLQICTNQSVVGTSSRDGCLRLDDRSEQKSVHDATRWQNKPRISSIVLPGGSSSIMLVWLAAKGTTTRAGIVVLGYTDAAHPKSKGKTPTNRCSGIVTKADLAT